MTDAPVWEDGRAASYPSLVGDVNTDICVIGLGGSGLAAIHELLQLGKRVVGLDAGIVGGGAAGRNGGFLLAGLADFYHDAVASIGRDRARQIYCQTIDELDRMTAETPDIIRRNGSLRIAADDAELADCRVQLDAMRADHLPAEWYEGPEGRGLLIPTDGVFDPLRRCRMLAASAQTNGAALHERSATTAIAGDTVTTATGQVHCRQVIVAVDGLLSRVLPETASRVQSARLQMLATAPTMAVRLDRPVYSRWSYDYWQQLPDGSIALGGGRDVGGTAEWTDEATATPAVQAHLDRVLEQQIGVTVPVTRRWAGIVGYTPDGLPFVAEVRPAVWALGGYSGTGNILGALAGRGVARQVVHGTSPLLAALWPAS
ncbi:MAG TPA: FAD-binding oxidoreductase [Gemmatimonadales bacterium]|nr:FAD-binding oxidoreductase [Gemmatimonadales bacterium]